MKNVLSTTEYVITDYLDGFQYHNTYLKNFPTAEGYVQVLEDPNNYRFFYVYNYTDHLGNIRLSYGFDPEAADIKILEENHYYPFGLKHTNYNNEHKQYGKMTSEEEQQASEYRVRMVMTGELIPYKYKYNGKEWQDELGLNMYAMDMRQYDPAIARWVVQDPVVHHFQSPYNGYDSNPIFWADPSGADSEKINLSNFDIFGREKFDSRGIYIAPDSRGPINMGMVDFMNDDENRNGGTYPSTITYTLLNDQNNIHQLSIVETHFSEIEENENGVYITSITTTTVITIQLSENEPEYLTTKTIKTEKKELGSKNNNFMSKNKCNDCSSKSFIKTNKGFSSNKELNQIAKLIGNNIKVNNEFNLFNQSNTIFPPFVSSVVSGIDTFLFGTKFSPFIAIDAAEGFDYYKKKYKNYSGSSVDVKLNTNGSISLYNYKIN